MRTYWWCYFCCLVDVNYFHEGCINGHFNQNFWSYSLFGILWNTMWCLVFNELFFRRCICHHIQQRRQLFGVIGVYAWIIGDSVFVIFTLYHCENSQCHDLRTSRLYMGLGMASGTSDPSDIRPDNFSIRYGQRYKSTLKMKTDSSCLSIGPFLC